MQKPSRLSVNYVDIIKMEAQCSKYGQRETTFHGNIHRMPYCPMTYTTWLELSRHIF